MAWATFWVNFLNKNLVTLMAGATQANLKRRNLWQGRLRNFLVGKQRSRVARFLLVNDTKMGKNVPNEYKMNQMVIKYPKAP
jgi:hypothetical protein